MRKNETSNGKKGGLLKGKPHYDKNGKPLGGIKAIVTDTNTPVELEGGEVIINKHASKKYWRELSKINQSAGNGVPIKNPNDSVDEDPEEYKEGGRIIDFNPNHLPNKKILTYAKKIKSEYPKVWGLGGNIFGNEAFKNLQRVSERGYWLESEKWMYIKWRSFVARHTHDFRIKGVIAMLKWVDKVDKGWQYMKDLIEAEIEKKYPSKMAKGGNVVTYKNKFNKKYGFGLNDSHSLEEIAKITKIKLSALQDIYDKGIGAYKTNPESVRPNVKSKEQWAMARVYSAVMGGKASVVDRNELSRGKMEKGGLIAPNGKPSNLTPEQYKMVRTKAFKDWFGDWENDPENASKVVDGNGEPLVVYHGTKEYKRINTFKIGKRGYLGGGIYLTSDKEKAKGYAQYGTDYINLYELFLVIKNPLIVEGSVGTDDFLNKIYGKKSIYEKRSSKQSLDTYLISKKDIVKLNSLGYDGVFWNLADEYVVYNSNQIKLADGTNTTFDGNNPDIRYAEGGDVDKNTFASKYSKNTWHKLSKESRDEFAEDIAKIIVESYSKKGGNFEINNADDVRKSDLDFYIAKDIDEDPDIDLVMAGKDTKYGKKITIVGQDGTIQSKRVLVKDMASYLMKLGVYAEVDLNMAQAMDLYIVNNEKRIREILNKDIFDFNPSDGSYKRQITGGVSKTKVLVGFPYERNLMAKGGLIAPNGKQSNLTPEQYKLVRTKSFKDWFGDWENDPANASKIVDENGEPLVVYHGSRSKFNVFDIGKGGESNSVAKVGFWFTPIKNFAKNFASSIWYGKSKNVYIYSLFLSIKNPKIYESDILNENEKQNLSLEIKDLQNKSRNIQKKWVEGDWNYKDRMVLDYSIRGAINDENYNYYSNFSEKSKDAIKDGILISEINKKIKNIENKIYGITFSDSYEKYRTDIFKLEGRSSYDANVGGLGMGLNNQNETINKYIDLLVSEGNDGIIIKKTKFDMSNAGGINDQIVALYPNQIKLADGSNTTFDGNNPDIRYAEGGELAKGIKAEKEHIKTARKLYNREITPEQSAREIAKDHLKEYKHYYSELEKMESKFENGGSVGNNAPYVYPSKNKPIFWQMTKKQFCDYAKSNNMDTRLEGTNAKLSCEDFYKYTIIQPLLSDKAERNVFLLALQSNRMPYELIEEIIRSVDMWGFSKKVVEIIDHNNRHRSNAEIWITPKETYLKKETFLNNYTKEEADKWYKNYIYDNVYVVDSFLMDLINRGLVKYSDVINRVREGIGMEKLSNEDKEELDKFNKSYMLIVTKSKLNTLIDLIESEKVYSNNQSIVKQYLNDNEIKFMNEVIRLFELSMNGFDNGITTYNKTKYEKLGRSFGITEQNKIKELVELAISKKTREYAHTNESVIDKFDNIEHLYLVQPNLSHRTSQSTMLQQYSTPAPIGYLMGIYCGIDKKGTKYFEPSAGNGLLVSAGHTEDGTLNELDKTRNDDLHYLGFENVTNLDASLPFPQFAKKFDAVLTNPPFGSVDKPVLYGKSEIKSLEMLMALRGLDTMKDDGKSAIIIGGHMEYDSEGRLKEGKNKSFFIYLYANYNIEDIINIDGQKLYSRQGTSYNTRLILINGRKKEPSGIYPLIKNDIGENEPFSKNPVKTFNNLYERIVRLLSKKEKKTKEDWVLHKINNKRDFELGIRQDALRLPKDADYNKMFEISNILINEKKENPSFADISAEMSVLDRYYDPNWNDMRKYVNYAISVNDISEVKESIENFIKYGYDIPKDILKLVKIDK